MPVLKEFHQFGKNLNVCDGLFKMLVIHISFKPFIVKLWAKSIHHLLFKQ